ncbi:MAG TPA: hypothetical protein DIW77_06795 [Chromatiaceae bacterium]|nr:hypothetical protein [Chromatiaceae bacterium]
MLQELAGYKVFTTNTQSTQRAYMEPAEQRARRSGGADIRGVQIALGQQRVGYHQIGIEIEIGIRIPIPIPTAIWFLHLDCDLDAHSGFYLRKLLIYLPRIEFSNKSYRA